MKIKARTYTVILIFSTVAQPQLPRMQMAVSNKYDTAIFYEHVALRNRNYLIRPFNTANFINEAVFLQPVFWIKF